MITNKINPWQWILIIVAVLVAVGSTTLTADASGTEPPSAIFMYNGVAVKYYKTDYMSYKWGTNECAISTDKDVYIIAFEGEAWQTFSLEPYTITWGTVESPSTTNVIVNSLTGVAEYSSSSIYTDFSMGTNSGYLYTSDFTKAFGNYLKSEEFVEPEIEPTIVENTIYLKNFEVFNGFEFLWSGIYGLDNIEGINLNDVEVVISPMYYAPNVGWVDDLFDSPDSVTVPLTNYSFLGSYNNYMENCPYENVQLSFVVTPRYYHEGSNTLYNGAFYTVTFDANGNVTNINYFEFDPSPSIIDTKSNYTNLSGASFSSDIPTVTNPSFTYNGRTNALSSYSDSATIAWDNRFYDDEYYIHVRTEFKYTVGNTGNWEYVTIDTSVPTGRFSTLADANTFTINYGDYADLYWSPTDSEKWQGLTLDRAGNIQIEQCSIRFVRVQYNNGISSLVSYGPWTTFSIENGWKLNSTGQVTDITVSDHLDVYVPNIPELDNDGNSIINNGFDWTDVSKAWNSFLTMFNGLISFLGEFPALFGQIFSFLPYEVRSIIYISLISICVVSLGKVVIR